MPLEKTFITLFLLGMIIVSTFAYSGDTDVIAIAGTETGILLWSPQQPNKDLNIHLSAQEEKALIFNLRISEQLQETLTYLAIFDSDAISESTRSAAKKAIINMLNSYDRATSNKIYEIDGAVKGILIGVVPVTLDNGRVRFVLQNSWETMGSGIYADRGTEFIRFLPLNSSIVPVILLNPQQPNKDVNVPLKDQEGLYTLHQALRTSGQWQEQQITLGSIVLENDGTLSLLTLNKRVVIKPSVYEGGIQDVLMNLAIVHVDPSRVVQARAKEILEKADTDYIRKTLVQLATAEWFSEEVRARAKEIVLKMPLGIWGQLELLKIAFNEDHSLTRYTFHIIKEVENIQARATEILLEMTVPLHLEIQEQLVVKALSDPVPRTYHLTLTVRDRARDILINVELDSSIQEELLSIATAFLRPSQKRDLFDRLYGSDRFFYNPELLQTRAQEILIEREALDLEVQQELVRLATSDVAHAIAQIRAKEILIEREALDLEVQQKLARIATNSDTFLPKIRAREILGQIKNIHPKIARSMGISLRCRRAFRRWAPTFAVAN